MKTSSVYSIPEILLQDYHDRCKIVGSYSGTKYTIKNGVHEIERNDYCFGYLSGLLRAKTGEKTISWKISIAHWNKPRIKPILNQYLHWAISEAHRDWFKGMIFDINKDFLIITFPDTLNKNQLIFATFIFRRIGWAPITILNWHLLRKMKAPLGELNLLIAANFVNFGSKYRVSVDDAHFVLGTIRSMLYYNTKLPDPAEVFKHHVPLTGAGSFTTRWLPPLTAEQKALDKDLRTNLGSMEKERAYGTLSSRW